MADLDLKFGADNPVQTDPLQDKLHNAVRLRESILSELKATPGLTNSVFLALVMFLNGADEFVLARMKSILPRLSATHDGQLLVDDVPFTTMMLFGGMAGPVAPQALGGGSPSPVPGANPGVNPAGNQLDPELLAASQAVQAWAQGLGMSVPDTVATLTGYVTGLTPLNAAQRAEVIKVMGRVLRGDLTLASGGNGRLEVEDQLRDTDRKFGEVREIHTALTAVHGDRRNLVDAIKRLITSGGNLVPQADMSDMQSRLTEAQNLLRGARAFIGTLRGQMRSRTIVGRGIGRIGNYDANVIVLSTTPSGSDPDALDPQAQSYLSDPTRIPAIAPAP